MENCVFCKIVKGQIPSAKVYEDKFVICFLDIAPANKGHLLLVPRNHIETYLDIPDKVFHQLNITLKKIIKALSHALGNKGYNLLMNNYKVAGQLVPHAHIHIIPRFEHDGITLNWRPKKYAKDQMRQLQHMIKKFL